MARRHNGSDTGIRTTTVGGRLSIPARQTVAVKVAFVGSFSTGKTTLANLFAREWDYPLLPEVARQVVELGFALDQSATAETETLIFLKQWRAEASHERVVAHRSIYDVLAYARCGMEHPDGHPKTK